MALEQPLPEELVESAIEGDDIDWISLAAAARDDEERRYLDHLRLLANVAALHRVSDDEGAEPDAAHAARAGANVVPFPGTLAGSARSVEPPHTRWGHFELIERVGEGSYGEVFRARDTKLDREVAVKLFRPEIVSQRSVRERVLHEGRALARIEHPNVVRVYSAEEHGGRLGLCMEFVRGRTLEDVLQEQGPMGAEEAAHVGREVCRALAAVHGAGFVHRDVKTRNVMRAEGGRIVLMDFGAVDMAPSNQGQQPRGVSGTPMFMAPEVLAGAASPSVASEIYSVGVVMYRLLSGEYPRTASSLGELKRLHQQGAGTPLRARRPDLPFELVSAIERALDRAPTQRPHDVAELEVLLSRWTSRPGLSRRRWLALGMLGSIVLLALALWSVRILRSLGPPGPSAHKLVAVLPFDVVGSQRGSDYLARALSISMIENLADLGDLRVIPWTATSNVGRDPGSRAAFMRDSAVDYLVDGDVLLDAEDGTGRRHARVNVRLLRASTGAIVWTRELDSVFEDLLDSSRILAKQVANVTGAALFERDRLQAASYKPTSEAALEQYFRGLDALMGGHSLTEFRGAIDHFRRATELDPRFAAAFVGVAHTHVLLAGYWGVSDSASAYASASAAANRALELDGQAGEAWAIKAYAAYVLGWNWREAQESFARALELTPDAPLVQNWYSDYLTAMGRHPEAVAAALAAKDRAPRAAAYSRRVAWAYFFARDYHGTIRYCQQALAEDPQHLAAVTLLARAENQLGESQAAIDRLLPLASLEGPYDTFLAQAYALSGASDEARELLRDSILPRRHSPLRPYLIAQVQAALGDRDAAVASLTESVAVHEASAVVFGVDPHFDTLRADPRYIDLLSRAGFPDTVRR